jgi:phosphoribosylaminoimidazole-succinocarboxamide synthase
MQKATLLHQGKAKSVYATDHPDYCIMVFRDDASAFNGVKLASLARKGKVNNHINAWFMQHLMQAGIATHFEKTLAADNEALFKRLNMIPVECVVRNRAAGSLCKRLGVTEGQVIAPPLFEFFLKDDALGDPLITEDHIAAFGWASQEEVTAMRHLSLQVNSILQPLFLQAGMILVDYKLEFGRFKGQVLLGDEFSPDGCRIWDSTTLEKLDKDRFRRDLGGVVEAYEIVAERLGIPLNAL